MAAADGPVRPGTEAQGQVDNDDDVVIDITDATLARQALEERLAAGGARAFDTPADSAEHAPELSIIDGEVVIDLRELTPTGRVIDKALTPSGRPPDLLEGHRLVTITGGDRWMDAEAFVYERYVQVGFTAESGRKQVEELARWADKSRFHAIVNDDDSIVGTIRTIFGAYDELPVGQFERVDFHDPDPLCEFSSVVVDPTVRSSGVLEHLFRAAWADARRSEAKAVVCLIDRWLVDVFRHTYSLPFVPIGIPHYHMGGNVIPLTMSTSREAMAEIARNNPDYWLWNLEALTPEEVVAYDLAGLVSADAGPAGAEAGAGAAAESSASTS